MCRSPAPARPESAPAAGLGLCMVLGVPICSANSSLGPSSSIPGSSGARTIGMMAGIGAGAGLPRSARVRNTGVAAAGDDSATSGAGLTGSAGVTAGSSLVGGRRLVSWPRGAANCPARRATGSGAGTAGSTGLSLGAAVTRFGGGAASMASSKAEDSIVAPLSEGRLATGVCHWNASRRPVTGETGRQRSLT